MLTYFIRKMLGLYVSIRYRNVSSVYRYYYRDTLYCQLAQVKYFFKDYIIKKPYKEISFQGEFTPDMIFVLPFAYWHHKNGTLKKTIDSTYSKELYFFSPDHDEHFNVRTTEGNYNFETPRVLYSQDYNISKWKQVPLKETYKNTIYTYKKPVLVIANRYNMEWDGPPISFFSKPLIKHMIEELKDKYTIVYNRPRPHNITLDNSDIYDLDEYDWIEQEYPEVILMESLYKENKGNARNFNHLQLMVYANADCFISIHGGTCALASYFGGINIILSKQGPEHYFKCFENIYPKLSGAKILHAKTDDEVKDFIARYY